MNHPQHTLINEPTLITGAHGMLGKSLSTYFTNAHCPRHNECDITYKVVCPFSPKIIVHCAAVKSQICDKDRIAAMETNIVGTANVARFAAEHKALMVYISTDYVFRGDRGRYSIHDEVMPQNYYGETKLAGEYVTKAVKEHLIVRLSFSEAAFRHTHAFTDQYTSRITVGAAAGLIAELIRDGHRGLHHIAGPRKSVYEYAKSLSPDVQPSLLPNDGYSRPKDTSLI